VKAAEKAAQLGLLLWCRKPYAQSVNFELVSRLHLPDLAGWCLVELGLWGFIGGFGWD
jgi:hypothetical protein